MVKQIVKQKNIFLVRKKLLKKNKIGGTGRKKTISDIYKENSKIYIVDEQSDKRKDLFNDDLYKSGPKDFVEIDGITYQINKILPINYDIVKKRFLQKYDKESDSDKKKYSIIEPNLRIKKEYKIRSIFQKEISSPTIDDYKKKLDDVINKVKQENTNISRMANSIDVLTPRERDILSKDVNIVNHWLTEIEKVLKKANTNIHIVLQKRLDDIKELKVWHKSKGRNLLKSKKCKQDNEKKVQVCKKMDAIKKQINARISVLSKLQNVLEEIKEQDDKTKLTAWRADNQDLIGNDDSGILQKALEEQISLIKVSKAKSKRLIDEINKINNDIFAIHSIKEDIENTFYGLLEIEKNKVIDAIQTKHIPLSDVQRQRLIADLNDNINNISDVADWELLPANVTIRKFLTDADQQLVTNAIEKRRTELSYGRKEWPDSIVEDTTDGVSTARTAMEWLNMNPKNFIIVGEHDYEIQYTGNYDNWVRSDKLEFNTNYKKKYPKLYNTVKTGDIQNWYWRCKKVNPRRFEVSRFWGNVDTSKKYWKHPDTTDGKYELPQWLENGKSVPGTRVFRRIPQPPSPFVSRKVAEFSYYYGLVSGIHCQTSRNYFNLDLVPQSELNNVFSHKRAPDVVQEIQDRDPANPLQFIFSGDNNLDVRTRAKLANWFGQAVDAPNDRRAQLLAFASGNDVINRENTNAFKPIILDVNDQDQLNTWGDAISKLRNWIQNNPRAAFGRPINNWANPNQAGGKKKKKVIVNKIVRKHRGIIQTGGNKGRLRKGYKYTGKKLKNGLPQITKCRINKL